MGAPGFPTCIIARPMSQVCYAFEEIGDELARPPLAALRALFMSGLVVSPGGWRALPPQSRYAVTAEGHRDVISPPNVRALLRGLPLQELKMVATPKEPDASEPPPALQRAMGGTRVLAPEEWRLLRPLDRFVLRTLSSNPRLYGKALDEILRRAGLLGTGPGFTQSPVAHVEVSMASAAIAAIQTPSFLDGRALMLARTPGVRAARAFADTFDMHAHAGVGIVELDASARADAGIVLWQAHVSLWDGSFSAAASLAAATTSAVALIDMVRQIDPAAQIIAGAVREEGWQVGDSLFQDDATSAYIA